MIHHEEATPIWKQVVLYPLSLRFQSGVYVRNKLFDLEILKSKKFDLPVISIGNINVGGTGKTPHSEYLIQLLQDQWKVILLSRGYKRKSKGFILADNSSTAEYIGDEPFQIARKFPNINVAVDEKRVHGIEQLQQLTSPPEVVLLDDAYQHRQLTPGLSILLIDYYRLTSKDSMLPLGRLREPVSNSDRANIIVITKCPSTIKPVDMMTVRKEVAPYPFQTLYFSTYSYGDCKAIFPKVAKYDTIDLSQFEVLAMSAIASPKQFHRYLKKQVAQLDTLSFGDHHFFTPNDYEQLSKRFHKQSVKDKIIIVTEKDEARLLNDPLLPEDLKPYIYSLPIKVKFLNNRGKAFDNQIIDYVEKSLKSI